MQTSFACLCLALISASSALCQVPAREEVETPQHLKQAIAALEQARQELQDVRTEMQDLRKEVSELRAVVDARHVVPLARTEERIARLEEEQQIHSSRIEQQYQTKVESGSKYRVRLSGLLLFNTSINNGAVNDQDVPNLALRVPPGSNDGSISASFRQTLLTLELFGPKLAGARTSASAKVDFLGGFSQTLDGSVLGLPRLRTARADFVWKDWDLTIAQEQPFISPQNPSSLASVGTPALGYSGNLWTWTPQVVLRRKWGLGENSKMTTEFGFLDPLSGELPYDEFSRRPNAGERSRIPAMAVRQALNLRRFDQQLQIGIGGYYAQHDYGYQRDVDAWAATVDWNVPVTNWFEWSGEFYRGRALGGLWGGIGASVVYTGEPMLRETQVVPVDSVGGWSQLKFKPTSRVEFNAAFGQDNPFAAQIRQQNTAANYAPSLRNQTALLNVIQRLRSNLLVSVEYRRLKTISFGGFRYSADHVNAAFGVEF